MSSTDLEHALSDACLTLLFTPEHCAAEPLTTLEASLPFVDVVQVRIKHPVDPDWASPARELHGWTRRVLDVVRSVPSAARPLVIVNDRVDVAASLAPEGVAGVHVGDQDTPPAVCREVLGPTALVGLSTHSTGDVVRAQVEPIDYLGFGPVHPTRTKGYVAGLGPEAAWIAAEGSALPVFPIGGIDETNAGELAPIGRAAVSTAILAAPDPGRAASALRSLLEREERPFAPRR